MKKYFKEAGAIELRKVSSFYIGVFVFFFLFIAFGDFPSFSHPRWYTGLDINQDGIYSVTDVIKWALWIFHMPGDVLVQGLLTSPDTAVFFEVSENSFGKVGSTLFSFMYWYLTGGRKLVKYWFVILLVIMLKNLPGIPFLY